MGQNIWRLVCQSGCMHRGVVREGGRGGRYKKKMHFCCLLSAACSPLLLSGPGLSFSCRFAHDGRGDCIAGSLRPPRFSLPSAKCKPVIITRWEGIADHLWRRRGGEQRTAGRAANREKTKYSKRGRSSSTARHGERTAVQHHKTVHVCPVGTYIHAAEV